MHILYASYEAAPFFQTGGLGEVARSLPNALSKIGIKVTLILPCYNLLKLPSTPKKIGDLFFEFAGRKEKITILQLPITKGVNLYLVDHPYLHQATEKKEKAEKFILYSKAIAQMAAFANKKQFGSFDLVHLNDWHTAATSVFLSRYQQDVFTPPNLLNIHNLLYQGFIKRENLLSLLKLTEKEYKFFTVLEAGIYYTDYISTVSPTYAHEITHTKLGLQMQKLLYSRRNKIEGILNGIDYDIWNPEKDKYIKFKFSSDSFEKNKAKNKADLLQALKLSGDRFLPLVSFIGRMEPNQKGINLICAMLEAILPDGNFQFVLLGSGHNTWVGKMGRFVKKYPKRVAFINKFDIALSHKIYASSDIILIPSKFEPCGLVQMIAMRYGTLPLVRNTGGLADTVKDGVNGFVFERYSPTEFTRTMRLVLKLFKENPACIAAMRKTAMKKDFSWAKSAREYKKLYNKVRDGPEA